MPKPALQLPALANAAGPEGELWAWTGNYDSFLGYMADVLPLLKAGKTGFDVL